MALMKKLTAAIAASSLVLGLVGTAFAGYNNDTATAGAQRMVDLKLVQGRDGGDLALNATITRAELMTIMVRAFGKADVAALLKTAVPFPDVKGHWAAGEIALAQQIMQQNGFSVGLPDGNFNPNGNVTSAEAVAFLSKFLGVQPTTANWPMNYLQGAVNAGLITADDEKLLEPQASTAATRGLVFYLADNAFYSFKTAAGKTIYTTFADTQLPTLTLTNAATATTGEAKVTVSGTAADDKGFVQVFVGSTPVALTNGQFSADVDLKMGDNNIAVTAQDKAGNSFSQSIKVTRAAGNVATLSADAITVTAGATVDVAVVAKDDKGNEVKDAAVTGTSTLGTFDAGKFTAGKTAGTGTLTLKVGDVTKDVAVTVTAGALDHVDLSAASVAPGTKVALTAKDANGNAISGVTFTQTSADALVDSTSGTFIASKAGAYTVTATVAGVSKNVTVSVYDSTVASYSVSFGAAQIVANNSSSTTMTVKAMDKFGNVVATSPNPAATAPIAIAGSVQISTDNGDTWVAPGATLTLTKGTATVLVRTSGLSGYGGQTVKATVGDANTGYNSATLSLVDQVATSVYFSNSATYMASNDVAGQTVNVSVKDQNGVKMLNGYFPISVALNAGVPAAITGNLTTVYYVGGAADQAVTVTPNYVGATGSVTLTGSATGLTTASKTFAMQLAGPAAKLAVSADSNNPASPKAGVANAETVTYTVSLTDAAGVPVTNVNPTTVVVYLPGLTSSNNAAVTVAQAGNLALSTDAAGGYKSAPLTFANGVATFTVKAGAITGPVNFLVKDTVTTNPLAATATQSPNFVANAPVSITFAINGNARTSVDVAAGASEFDIVATLKDEAGNATTGTNATFTLTAATTTANLGSADSDVVINDKAGSNAITFDATGKATIHVKAGNFIGASYTLTPSAASYTAANGATTAINTLPAVLAVNLKYSVAANVSVVLYDYASYFANQADQNLWLPLGTPMATGTNTVHAVATVVDAAGRKITNETLKVDKVNSDGTTTNVIAAVNPVNGVYSFDLAPTTAPGVTYKVSTANTTAALSTQFTVGVRANTAPGSVAIVGASSAQSIARLTEKAVTINLADAYKNALTDTVAHNVGLSFSKLVNNVATPATVQVRTTSGGLALTPDANGVVTVSIPAGQQSVTVYVVTSEAAGTSFTATADGGFGANFTSTATFNVQ